MDVDLTHIQLQSVDGDVKILRRKCLQDPVDRVREAPFSDALHLCTELTEHRLILHIE